MTSYLLAVMEHHNEPDIFDQRDAFIALWKSGVWDVFAMFGSGQKKFLKKEMKGLTKEWERELDDAMRRMGREEYDSMVARFVGSVVPGRKDQGLASRLYPCTALTTQSWSLDGVENMGVDGMNKVQEEEDDLGELHHMARNELLEALRVPVDEQGGQQKSVMDQAATITDLRYAISTMQRVRPREILLTLTHLFPSNKENRH